jgi:hypothetical protein
MSCQERLKNEEIERALQEFYARRRLTTRPPPRWLTAHLGKRASSGAALRGGFPGGAVLRVNLKRRDTARLWLNVGGCVGLSSVVMFVLFYAWLAQDNGSLRCGGKPTGKAKWSQHGRAIDNTLDEPISPDTPAVPEPKVRGNLPIKLGRIRRAG